MHYRRNRRNLHCHCGGRRGFHALCGSCNWYDAEAREAVRWQRRQEELLQRGYTDAEIIRFPSLLGVPCSAVTGLSRARVIPGGTPGGQGGVYATARPGVAGYEVSAARPAAVSPVASEVSLVRRRWEGQRDPILAAWAR